MRIPPGTRTPRHAPWIHVFSRYCTYQRITPDKRVICALFSTMLYVRGSLKGGASPTRVRPCSIVIHLNWTFAIPWNCDAPVFRPPTAAVMVYKYNFLMKSAYSATPSGRTDRLREASGRRAAQGAPQRRYPGTRRSCPRRRTAPAGRARRACKKVCANRAAVRPPPQAAVRAGRAHRPPPQATVHPRGLGRRAHKKARRASRGSTAGRSPVQAGLSSGARSCGSETPSRAAAAQTAYRSAAMVRAAVLPV